MIEERKKGLQLQSFFILVQVVIENISINNVMADLFRHLPVNHKEGMPDAPLADRHNNFTT